MAPVASSSASSSHNDPEYLLGHITDSDRCELRKRQTASSVIDQKFIESLDVRGIDRTYNQQFANLYFTRLSALKPDIVRAAAQTWDGMKISNKIVKQVDRVLDVEQGELCWIVGTVYLDMALKPNIFTEISDELWAAPPMLKGKYRSKENDTITLEDESGRVTLIGSAINRHGLVTGCVIAVLGSETESGDFEVVDVILPELAPQVARPKREVLSQRRYIALLSGLDMDEEHHGSLELQLLVEFLRGELGGNETTTQSSQIVQVIIAGNSFRSQDTENEDPNRSDSSKTVRKFGKVAQFHTKKTTAIVDDFVASICSSVPTDLMAGEHDPTVQSLPQRPLHPALLPESRSFMHSSFRSLPNPCRWNIEDDEFADMMEQTLRWRHCAPTAPDTLWCYPFVDRDPFIIDETPHIYFAGNQPQFSSHLVRGSEGQEVRTVAIPKFSETSQLVLVDLDTLDCEIINFRTNVELA
ncbi:DNA polymerase alpha/epsilon subunit B-domain-containing protein [Dipodascopsis tothii]|uniref:DNA polymerase alpha/epsilon subunit B-domain-containing protein n=1 Tax=Dipodascopsis tothii TaxID=44089 RepID=UPI0034CF7CF0